MNNNSGIGLSGVLGVVFLVLKLTGVIHWSWLWVLSPFWIPVAIVATFFGALGLLALIVALFK